LSSRADLLPLRTSTTGIPLLPKFIDANTATGQFLVERDRYVDGSRRPIRIVAGAKQAGKTTLVSGPTRQPRRPRCVLPGTLTYPRRHLVLPVSGRRRSLTTLA